MAFFIAHIIYTFYRHRSEMRSYLDSGDAEISQGHFYRMFALGCFDIFITLPITTTDMVTDIVGFGPGFMFYQGWTYIHDNWEPNIVLKSVWSKEKWGAFSAHWNEWINVLLALAFFFLFGLTSEARKGYRRFFRFLARPFGVKQVDNSQKTDDMLPEAVFKSGTGTNATVTSNISSRYGISVLSARKHFSIKFI